MQINCSTQNFPSRNVIFLHGCKLGQNKRFSSSVFSCRIPENIVRILKFVFETFKIPRACNCMIGRKKEENEYLVDSINFNQSPKKPLKSQHSYQLCCNQSFKLSTVINSFVMFCND